MDYQMKIHRVEVYRNEADMKKVIIVAFIIALKDV